MWILHIEVKVGLSKVVNHERVKSYATILRFDAGFQPLCATKDLNLPKV